MTTVRALLTATLVSVLGSAPAIAADARSRDRGDTSSMEAARVARVERGLLPKVAIRGQRDTTYAIADRMRRYGVPGVGIAVIDQGRVVWARAYGLLEAGGTQRVDTATLFQAGSISKALTALAALRLVASGRLGLEEDVNARLRSWQVPEHAWSRTRPVTLRGLLSHGAGLNVPSFPGYAPGTAVPTLLQVLDGTPPANTPPVRVEAEPGTTWRYSGGGFTVLQQLLADVSGRTFPDLLRAELFEPTSMRATLAEQPLLGSRRAASGHSGGAPIPGRARVYPELAAAGMWSTATDLARAGVAVIRAVRGERGSLLEPALARAMVTRQAGDWGLGFALGASGDSATVGHDGSTAGFAARVLVIPTRGQGIAIMTNGESEALLDEIQRAVAREYAWPVRPRPEHSLASVDRAGYDALSGRYRVELGDRHVDFVISVAGSGADRQLLITGSGGVPATLLPLSERRFFSQETGNEFTFASEGNSIVHMAIDQQGQRFVAKRIR